MKKLSIKLGQELFWDGKEDNVAVIVIDVDLPNEQVGIRDGGITHIVSAEHLETKPYYSEENVTDKIDESVVEPVSTKPVIDLVYDETVSSLFILINDKTTICIPNVLPSVIDAVGIAYKHDDDSFNLKIGTALSYYRAKENINESLKSFADFLCGK